MRSSAAMATRPNRLLLPGLNASSSCKPLDACRPLPPLPTLLTPPPPPPQESSTSVRFRHSTLLPALPITAASLLAAAAIALLLGFFFLRRRRRSRAGAAPAAPDEGPGPFEGGGDGEVDHHVWYIRTTGLDESAIRAITAWAYKADDDVLGASAADCAVCLSEFHDGELVRRLPKCGHAFHLSCIDTWLRSHVNCPLCRAPVVAPTSVTSGADPGASTSSSSSFSSALASPDFILDHMEPNSVSSALLDQIDGQQSPTARGALEVETEGERLELGAGDPIVIDQIRNSELRVPSDIGEQGFQPIRRSFSMGTFTCELYIHRSKLEEGLDGNTNGPTLKEEWDNRTWRKKGNASCGTTLQKETGRSLSSAGERFFSARHRRAGSSVLPL